MLATNTISAANPASIGGSPDLVSTMSADGRLVVFRAEDAQSKPAFYLQDMVSGTVSKVPVPAELDMMHSPKISADGTKLAYIGAPFGFPSGEQIWITDLRTGASQVASSDSQGNSHAFSLYGKFSLSGDGSLLAFASETQGLVANDNNPFPDVFLKDLKTGVLKIVSSNIDGLYAGWSMTPQLSRDGKSVVFFTNGDGIGDGLSDTSRIVIKNLQTGVATVVNKHGDSNLFADVLLSYYDSDVMISADGSKVVYEDLDHVYVKDLRSGTLTNVLTTSTGEGVWGQTQLTGISADGRYITFTSTTRAKVAGDADDRSDVYQKDMQTGQLVVLTPHATRSGAAIGVAASDDGATVLFGSTDRLVLGDGPQGPFFARGNSLNLAHTNGLGISNGADIVFGTSGAEQLEGGNGNDWYWIDHATDAVLETANSGHDTAFSLLASYTLPVNVEDLVLAVTWDANVTPVVNAGGIGNDGNNQLIGNNDLNTFNGMGGNDVLIGGAGNDTLDGGTGIDIARFDGTLSGAKITRISDGVRVAGPFQEVDTLQNIERLEFSDQGFALPGDTNAAQAYRIYQATFNRTPDAGGLGFWIKQIDNGAKLTEVAKGFMQSAEFKNMYGTAPTNLDMVTKFYQNVLHRAPDAGGLTYWTDILNSKRGTSEFVLSQFAESPENVAALTGVIDAGFAFKLFG